MGAFKKQDAYWIDFYVRQNGCLNCETTLQSSSMRRIGYAPVAQADRARDS
jgi:hypothetical protein